MIKKDEKVILYNTAYQVGGKVITAFFGVVMTFLMTRYLGASGFGQYNFVLAFVGLAYILADFGLSPVLIRTHAEKSLQQSDFNTLFTFRICIVSILLVGAPLVSKFIFHYDSFVTLGIAIAGLANIFLMLSSMIWDLLKGSLEYHKIVLIQIFTSLIHCALIWYAVYASFSPILFFVILTIGYLGGFLLSWALSPFNLQLELDLKRLKKYLFMALPFALGVAVGIASARLNILMLGNVYSPSTYPYVGYYSLGMRIFDVVILIGGYYGNTLYPFLSQKNGARLRRQKFFRFLSYSVGIAVCVTGGMLIMARPFVTILAGPSFEPAIRITQILAWAAGITIIENLFFSYLLSMGREKQWVALSIVTVLLNIVLNILFIPMYSYIAVSWVMVATHAFSLIVSSGMLLVIEMKKRSV